MISANADELLLHGYVHWRERGWGPSTLLADRSDEMNGLDPEETRRAIERGQAMLAEVFGAPARGFVAPAWQIGHVRPEHGNAQGVEYVLGFFSLESWLGRRIPLTTWSWHCGRWGWLGHVGHGLGSVLQSLDRGIPSLAIHPKDLAHGFWPNILALTEGLLEAGYVPSTPQQLLEPSDVEVSI
jgi:hypothetical protein